MTETLRELNEEAIKDGLLLPDGRSYRKDFSDKLGQDLTGTEDRGYRVIHELTKKVLKEIIPTGVNEIFKNTYMAGELYQVTEDDIETMKVLVMRIRKKLGETAIETGRNDYRSRRKVIELAVESKVNIKQIEVSLPGIEPGFKV